MIENSVQMGIPFVPFTFPTLTVQGALLIDYPHLSDFLSWQNVQRIYNFYQYAVTEEGLPIYEKGNQITKTVNYIETKTGFKKSNIILVLDKIRELAKSGKISQKYWNFETASTVKNVITESAKVFDKSVKNIKVIGFIAIAGVVLYLSWPFLKRVRARS